RILRRASHVGAASGRGGRSGRDARRARSREPRGGADRLRESARHRDARERRSRGQGDRLAVRHLDAVQLDEGLDRSHARRGCDQRGGVLSAVHRARLRAAQPQHADARPIIARKRADAATAEARRSSAVEFLRLRRQQLQPHLRPRGMKVFVDAIGFAAPGMEDWESARRVLRGEAGYEPKALSLYQPNLLPPNERRRAAPAVRLAFRIAEDAMRTSSFKPSVLATSDADTSILHRLCTALAQPQRAVSPTDFHNSVHNAAAGYWSIAAGAKPPSTSLSAYDASFAAGLLEAATFVV